MLYCSLFYSDTTIMLAGSHILESSTLKCFDFVLTDRPFCLLFDNFKIEYGDLRTFFCNEEVFERLYLSGAFELSSSSI